MAPRKRKARKTARQRPSNNGSDVMTSHDPNAPRGARPSTGCTMSDLGANDDPHTAMTSLDDTEEEMRDVHDHHHELDDELETVSMYPASHHPRAPSMYRSGHSIPGDSRTIASDIASSTRSLWAMDLDYREIHGRRYCRDYFMPNDEIEQLRLTLQHQVLLHTIDNELTLVPVENPTHVLDIGTGTGEWAIRFAEMYPDCEVVGTDISAIAETRSVPINVFFEIEDAEDWDRPFDHYDIIHIRWMQGAFRDWSFIYKNAYDSIKPGGWIEVLDFVGNDSLANFFGNFPPGSPIHALFRDVNIAAEKSGRTRSVAHLEPLMFMDAGFVDVRCTEYILPIDVTDRNIGKIWLIVCLDSIESICLRLLTEHMDWNPVECRAACEAAALELANLARNPETGRNIAVKVRAIVGRKPNNAPSPPPAGHVAGEERMSPSRGSSSTGTPHYATWNGLESYTPPNGVNSRSY
ncbi:Methyltransferase pytC [Cladobotryum mycophilum]|uniref:Methyltransferase pytC n=1 Tax=Cladobotryum mycophilum TaxID=491253 RepID=A0ABR0SA97_9HYPO